MPVGLIALLAAACAVESGSRPDAGTDTGHDGGDTGPDAPPGAAGLVLEFRGVPALTASLEGPFDAELEEVRLDLEDVRAVGDSAPGDSRTSREALKLEWWGEDDGEDARNQPVVVTFDQAPPGLYSSVFAELKHYRLQGTVEVGENERDFDIEDEPSSELAISIPLGGVVLEAGETRRVIIDVACGAAVLATPWDEIPEDSGELPVGSSSPHIGVVRDAMDGAFTYQGDDEVTSEL